MRISIPQWLALLVCVTGLQACGLKGDLYLEEPTAEAPPRVELAEPESEADDPMDGDAEEVTGSSGVPAAEPGPLVEEAPEPVTVPAVE